MPQLEERILEVRVTSGESPQRFQVSAGSPGESFEQEVITVPEPKYWDLKLEKLQDALLLEPIARSGLPNARDAERVFEEGGGSATSTPLILQEIGQSLFEILFTRKIYAAFDKTLDISQREAVPLRIRLAIGVPELSHLPWEALYNSSSGQYLASSPRTPVVRATASDEAALLPPVNLPLCVLGMVPEARGFSSLNVEAEKDNIRAALGRLESDGLAKLGWTGGSVSDLIDRLDAPPKGCKSWHVFHFIGHGGYDDQSRKGYIIVDPDVLPLGVSRRSKSAAKLYADDLRSALETSNGLRLVILNSCNGAASSAGVKFSSTAERLILEGFMAVVAMQFEISDNAAIAFSAALYRQLARGDQIQEAVTKARMVLKRLGSPEWITPVLYMRTREGQLFRDMALEGDV